MPKRQSSLSTEYIAVPVNASVSGLDYNPSGDVVAMAFTATEATAPTVWNAGVWESNGDGSYNALVLVGPANGGVVLAPGIWHVWLKITDSPEVPVLGPVDKLTIY